MAFLGTYELFINKPAPSPVHVLFGACLGLCEGGYGFESHRLNRRSRKPETPNCWNRASFFCRGFGRAGHRWMWLPKQCFSGYREFLAVLAQTCLQGLAQGRCTFLALLLLCLI